MLVKSTFLKIEMQDETITSSIALNLLEKSLVLVGTSEWTTALALEVISILISSLDYLLFMICHGKGFEAGLMLQPPSLKMW